MDKKSADIEDINRINLTGLKEQDIGVIVETSLNPVGEHVQLRLVDRRTGTQYVVKAGYVNKNKRF